MRRRPAARRGVAALALSTGLLTAVGAVATGASAGHPYGLLVYGALVYGSAVVASLAAPSAIAVQVWVGQGLVGAAFLGSRVPAPLALLPLVAGVVATAELLAVAARLGAFEPRNPGPDLRRAGVAVAVAGGVYGAVALIGMLPGPDGVLAVAVASGACAALALSVARLARP